MKISSGLPSKKNGLGSNNKGLSPKPLGVPSSTNQNLVKMEYLIKGEVGIAPVKDSCQLILMAENLIRTLEQQPIIHEENLKMARELRTVLFFLRKAHEKLTELIPTAKQLPRTKGKGRLLEIV
jgi:hypothetical protein